MKETVSISIKTAETREVRYIKAAENAIQDLHNLIKEMEYSAPGTRIIANEECIDQNKTPVFFHVIKTIDTEAIKEPLENVEKLVKALKKEVDKLEAAVITEVAKENPQE